MRFKKQNQAEESGVVVLAQQFKVVALKLIACRVVESLVQKATGIGRPVDAASCLVSILVRALWEQPRPVRADSLGVASKENEQRLKDSSSGSYGSPE